MPSAKRCSSLALCLCAWWAPRLQAQDQIPPEPICFPSDPLIVATPVLGLLLNLDGAATAAVALTLLAGTPALTFTGMIGAALAVTLHRGGLLLAVLVLPLSIPVLIFGVAASEAAITGPQSFGAPFAILCALSLVSFVIGPVAAAASLRQGLD